MPKQVMGKFKSELSKLFERRTDWLVRQVSKPSVGRPPDHLKAPHVSRAIANLESITEDVLVGKFAGKDMADIFNGKRQWHVKGSGAKQKKKRFSKWFDSAIPNLHRNCVYVFWTFGGQECLYVGRTRNGKQRPHNHFEKAWFYRVARIDIYHSKGSRNIAKLECLATHRFEPRHSKIAPSKKKYLAKCPICVTRDKVAADVRAMFRGH